MASTSEETFADRCDAADWGTTDWVIDLRAGGKWSTRAIAADGSESTVDGEYLEVDWTRMLEWLGDFTTARPA